MRSFAETRLRFAGGGPSLSETTGESIASGAGDPFRLLSCEGGGVGRLGSRWERAREYNMAARISGGGDGERLPRDDKGDEEREAGGDDSGLLPREDSMV